MLEQQHVTGKYRRHSITLSWKKQENNLFELKYNLTLILLPMMTRKKYVCAADALVFSEVS